MNVDAVDQEAGLVTEEMEVEDIDHDHEIDIGPLDHIGDQDQETEKEGVVLGPIQGKEGKLRIVECEIFTINLSLGACLLGISQMFFHQIHRRRSRSRGSREHDKKTDNTSNGSSRSKPERDESPA